MFILRYGNYTTVPFLLEEAERAAGLKVYIRRWAAAKQQHLLSMCQATVPFPV